MDAIVLAAGFGTRLRPMTDRTPKALVSLAGEPLLDRVMRRLIDAGVTRVAVNLHHFADAIREHVESKNGYGIEVVFSPEDEEPYGTGGGFACAAERLKPRGPILVHNVDIISAIPLRAMVNDHIENDAMATLAIASRNSPRYLIFDDFGLCGRGHRTTGFMFVVRRPEGSMRELSFGGIHVISPKMLDLIVEQGVFSILDPYMRLAAARHPIRAFRVDEHLWYDVGRVDRLRQAERAIRDRDDEVTDEDPDLAT